MTAGARDRSRCRPRRAGSARSLPSSRRGGAEDLVGQDVALDLDEAPATSRVVPELAMRPARVVAEIDVIGERGLAGLGRRALDRGVARVSELDMAARPAPGAVDQHHGLSPLMRIGRGSGAALVDRRAAIEAIEREMLVELVRPVLRDRMRKAEARGGRCFEAAVAPAAVDIEALDR